MESIKLEFLQLEQRKKTRLDIGNKYLLVEGQDKPVQEFSVGIDHWEVMLDIAKIEGKKNLAYKNIIKNVNALSKKIRPAIPVPFDKPIHDNLIQLDVVLNPTELGLIPFEILMYEGSPFFANRERKIVITRRVRQEGLIAKKENWPIKPRLLFAFSNPGKDKLTEEQYNLHLNSLEEAIKPWKTKDEDFVTLENASIAEIKNKLKKAILKEKKPFTHVHILAHGKKIPHPLIETDFEYGIDLKSRNGKPTSVAQVKSIFENLAQKPFIVSYMVCDSGNFQNSNHVEKNLVQVTHEVGVPFVIGSQIPLSFAGAKIITEELYNKLFAGKDIRNILHDIRCKLYDNREETFTDWFGLVSYIRLPEGYEDYLGDSILKRELIFLEKLGKEIDGLLGQKTTVTYKDLALKRKSLLECKQRLEKNYKTNENNPKIVKGFLEENFGLVASAYKRLAELDNFENTYFNGKNSINENLHNAKGWYQKAANFNLSHHWSTVQYLSLTTILDGYPKDSYYWYAAFQAVLNDEQNNNNKIWALGSKAELYLLAPHIQPTKKVEEISKCFSELRALSIENDFPIDSTWRQFNRYINWWTVENGYHALPNPVPKQNLKELIDILKGGVS
ncbi:CHAT domain-containing protein [Haliscomenobacter sp.]|uniref:CHAT domain-containing protein n=1 Tax=Haliscomenobacter sp. TaxID=2717303 RepID=UPI003BAA7CD2